MVERTKHMACKTVMPDHEAEITRLKGQRAVLAGLLEKALITLHDVKQTTDDKETLANLTDLISWSTKAVHAVWIEDGFLHRPTGGTSNGN